MNATEWLESRGLPMMMTFVLGVLVTDTVRDWQAVERTEALVVRRVEAAFGGCIPREQLGAKAILVWREDGLLHCTRFEDLGYRRPTRIAGIVPVLSHPLLKEAKTIEEAKP